MGLEVQRHQLIMIAKAVYCGGSGGGLFASLLRPLPPPPPPPQPSVTGLAEEKRTDEKVTMKTEKVHRTVGRNKALLN